MGDPKGRLIAANPPKNPQPGQRVSRMIGGMFFMKMEIAAVTETEIGCWPVQDGQVLRSGDLMYRFDRCTGIEIDVILGWGPPTEKNPNAKIGSYIEEINSGESSGVDVQGRKEISCRARRQNGCLTGSEPQEGQGEHQLKRPDKVPDDPLE